ncbi:34 kDa antigenic family protein [Candidatus Frankia nodulisporulans]|uniref:34 kDa antigenic family protein n=1 Tax=Candidatus Frankia nodulisporulans TaxID=2060052 RepID=UPI0013D132C4|nr:34 kDa antigenic family protein [Candidatus Frankia nodulisporulans]
MTDQPRSPWARPTAPAHIDQPGRPASVADTPEGGGDRAAQVAADLRAWRARAAATADPVWARDGAAETRGPDWENVATPLIAAPWELPTTGEDGSDVPSAATERLGGTRPAARRRGLLAGPVAMGAGLGVIVASGMSWATVRAYGFIEFSLRGTDPGQHGRLTVVLGILAVLAGLLLTGRRAQWGRLLASVAGLMVVVTAIIDLTRLGGSGPFEDSGLDASVTVGPGVWLVLACGLLVAAAGIAKPRAYRRSPPSGGHPVAGMWGHDSNHDHQAR